MNKRKKWSLKMTQNKLPKTLDETLEAAKYRVRAAEFLDQFLAELTLGSETNGYEGIGDSMDGESGEYGWFITPQAKERLLELITEDKNE